MLRKKIPEAEKMMNLCLCMESAEVCVFTSNSNKAMSSRPVLLHSP